ncbi:hypothetical protein [Profundibacterium mesophilum]|uniref:MSP domain-containing protein n=1 Tax=Profundibacterium mesophilum KAUST100406-0324 TaxID=1037889 RepID=A0A921NPK2_9RHOB|nr:hypothetical protein [Profundibacterium mesophilum]KAF0674720.1 hypothetical protein PMES_03103 [Profundibacterium mesophilum KAUST100406-0324]
MIRTALAICAAAAAALSAIPAAAAPLCDDLQFSGLLAACNRGEPIAVTLASGKPLAESGVTLESGAYYELEITADGSAELALSGAEFFHAIWINEVVINDIEIRPLGLSSFEFDDAGTASLSFIAIKPGSYALSIPGTTGASQRLEITIR